MKRVLFVLIGVLMLTGSANAKPLSFFEFSFFDNNSNLFRHIFNTQEFDADVKSFYSHESFVSFHTLDVFNTLPQDNDGNHIVDSIFLYGSNDDDSVFYTFDTFQLGVDLYPGVYSEAQRYPFHEPGHPGIGIFANWYNVEEQGAFKILQADFDYTNPNPVHTDAPKTDSFAATWSLVGGETGKVYYNYDLEIAPPVTVTPEPISTILMLAGGGVFGSDLLRRRRRFNNSL